MAKFKESDKERLRGINAINQSIHQSIRLSLSSLSYLLLISPLIVSTCTVLVLVLSTGTGYSVQVRYRYEYAVLVPVRTGTYLRTMSVGQYVCWYVVGIILVLVPQYVRVLVPVHTSIQNKGLNTSVIQSVIQYVSQPILNKAYSRAI